MDSPCKTVLIIGAGGTISSEVSNDTEFLNYPVSARRLDSHEIVELLLPNLEGIHLHFVDAFRGSSTEIGPSVWWKLKDLIKRAVEEIENLSGVVITHGTGTLEETAFALDLLLDVSIPVVVTGAQRPLGSLSSDAAHNLWSAIQVASHPTASNRGVLVVMNGDIHAAYDVSKNSNFDLDAFTSNNSGPIGRIEGVNVAFFSRRNPGLKKLAYLKQQDWPRVDIVLTYAGVDGELIRSSVSAGAKGVVVCGFPPGYASPDQRDALNAARRQGVIVVMASRAIKGVTVPLEQNGVADLIGSRLLSPVKARILLSLALMHTSDIAEIDDLLSYYQ